MILLLHIVIAFLSLIHAAFTYITPTRGKLRVSYVLVGATLVSGTYLIATSAGHHMAEACLTGVMYLGVASLGITASYRKLAAAEARMQKDR